MTVAPLRSVKAKSGTSLKRTSEPGGGEATPWTRGSAAHDEGAAPARRTAPRMLAVSFTRARCEGSRACRPTHAQWPEPWSSAGASGCTSSGSAV